MPDGVATTAYYVASEAVVNAVKHADAATIGLRVARVDGWLTERTVETHVGSIMSKLGLAATDEDHRRVLAVLVYLGQSR